MIIETHPSLEQDTDDYLVTPTGKVWRRMRPGEVELLRHQNAIDLFRDAVSAHLALYNTGGNPHITLMHISQALTGFDNSMKE